MKQRDLLGPKPPVKISWDDPPKEWLRDIAEDPMWRAKTWRHALATLPSLRAYTPTQLRRHWESVTYVVWAAFKHLPGAQSGDLQDDALARLRRSRADTASHAAVLDAIEAVAAEHNVSID